MTEMRTGWAARPARSNAKRNTDSARDSFGQSGTMRSSTSISLILHPPQVPQELGLPAQLLSGLEAIQLAWLRFEQVKAQLALISCVTPFGPRDGHDVGTTKRRQSGAPRVS
jgi:hypothetical protein